MVTFQVESDEHDPNPDEVYLFRFREYPKPWEPGEGWMAGMAGPIRDGLLTALVQRQHARPTIE